MRLRQRARPEKTGCMRRRRAGATVMAALTLGALFTGPPAGALEMRLVPAADNTLYESGGQEVSSGAGPALFAGAIGTGLRRRALLRFDTASLPAGAHVDSVQLVLRVTRLQDVGPRSFALHRVLASWGEGTSNAGGDSIAPGGGQGAPATIGDATWTYRHYDTERWSQAGGDFDPTPLALCAVGGLGSWAWNSTPALVADVQRWLDGGENHGWILLGGEGVANSARRFAARESALAGARPVLVVHFTPTAVAPATWSAVKSMLR